MVALTAISCRRCDAEALWLPPHDSAATTSSPADSSPPASLLRLPASASGPSLAPKPLLVAIPSCSSLSSSIGPPQEVLVSGTFLMGTEGAIIKEVQHP